LIIFIRSTYFVEPGGGNTLNAISFFISRLLLWVYLAIIFIYVIMVERNKFLLWSERRYSLLFYILSILAIALIIIVLIGILSNIEAYYGLNKSEKLKQLLQLLWKNKLLLLFTTLSAGIIEELLFRGYLMPRLQLILKHTWLTVTISSLLFALAHYSYGNWSQIINPFVIGLIFAIHYQKYRNIKVLILCHFLIDFISILTTH
jgi:membrane protease YdiL (CAAX protease family)